MFRNRKIAEHRPHATSTSFCFTRSVTLLTTNTKLKKDALRLPKSRGPVRAMLGVSSEARKVNQQRADFRSRKVAKLERMKSVSEAHCSVSRALHTRTERAKFHYCDKLQAGRPVHVSLAALPRLRRCRFSSSSSSLQRRAWLHCHQPQAHR